MTGPRGDPLVAAGVKGLVVAAADPRWPVLAAPGAPQARVDPMLDLMARERGARAAVGTS